MQSIVLGEGDFGLRDVARTIGETGTSFSELIGKWKAFARNLDIDELSITDLKAKQIRQDVQLMEIPYELLQKWKALKGSSATLKALCDALVDLRLLHVAECLEYKYFRPKVRVNWRKRDWSLEELLGNNTTFENYQRIFDAVGRKSMEKSIRLIRNERTLPKSPDFYIQRSLSIRTEIDEKIFRDSSAKDHIFLLKDISSPILAKVSGYQRIAISGNQLDTVTVRFIMLEHTEDFDKICRITNKPVHLIQYRKDRFYWRKSSHGLDIIENFLREGNCTGEDEAINIFTANFDAPITIADSPGMGKTTLLANLANNIKKSGSNVIVLFIVLQEFAKELGIIDSPDSAIEAMCMYASGDSVSRLVLQEMLKSDFYQVYLCLDGYDEVSEEKLDLIDNFLVGARMLRNFRIVVTTRCHLFSRLQTILNNLAIHILPFEKPCQIEFLTKYWSTRYGAESIELLQIFAKQCLGELETNLTHEEKALVGIPLQCRVLARVYANDAIRASKLKSISRATFKIDSFFDMYRKLMNLKFKKLSPTLDSSRLIKQKFIDAHVYEAFLSLFPEYIDKFLKIPNTFKERINVKPIELYSIGLIEESPYTKKPTFIHRTFAEYFVAEFLVENLTKFSTLSIICVELMLKEILGYHSCFIKKSDFRPTLYEIKHRVIAYFINMHFTRFCYEQLRLEDLLVPNLLPSIPFTNLDIGAALVACICHNFKNCFDFARKLLRHVKDKDKEQFKAAFIKHLPHIAVENLKCETFLKEVIELTTTKFGVDITFHKYNPQPWPHITYPWIPNCFPIHVAVYHSRYNIVTDLVSQYGNKILQVKHLLHVCVFNSENLEDDLIDQKISIINLLLDKNPKLLVEEFDSCAPILQFAVHIKLLDVLLQRGANVNFYSPKHGTILHRCGDRKTFASIVQLALKYKFDLFNKFDSLHRTSLHRAVERFGSLDDELLNFFIQNGVDFNSCDNVGDSVLFYALYYSRDINFIESLLKLRVEVNHRNKKGRNAAHQAIWGLESDMALQSIRLLVSKGLRRINEKDVYGKTPLDYANQIEIPDKDLIKFLTQSKHPVKRFSNAFLFFLERHPKSGFLH